LGYGPPSADGSSFQTQIVRRERFEPHVNVTRSIFKFKEPELTS
jgi:hypothetical protein